MPFRIYTTAPYITPPLLLLQLLLLTCLLDPAAATARFVDVSVAAGLQRALGRGRLKYGGATVADFDGDGWPDLLLGHHNDRDAELYFNTRNGRFVKSRWAAWNDTHALTPFRFSPYQRGLHFILSRGGGNGRNPSPPSVLRVSSTGSRAVTNVSRSAGLTGVKGRGRSVIVVNLRRGFYQFPHMLVLNAPADLKRIGIDETHYAFEAINGRTFRQRRKRLGYFAKMYSPYGDVADVDGDGYPEVLTWHDLNMHRVVGFFKLRDISTKVFPPEIRRVAVVGVAEFDYDNDGRFDLYVARSASSDLSYFGGTDVRDYLLRNVGGRYVDVSREAGIPQWPTDTRGVTTGDFDNDGWMDIIVTRHKHQDMMLRNNGDGTFSAGMAGFGRRRGVDGDMATAVDYDMDGRLDVVVSEGDYFDKTHGGHYRVMRNVVRGENRGGFILVTVRNEPRRKATSLHAVVTVDAIARSNGGGGKDKKKIVERRVTMVRRVGSPGTAVSSSYIETVHFGIGRETKVRSVSVRWINGTRRRRWNVKAGSKLVFGVK